MNDFYRNCIYCIYIYIYIYIWFLWVDRWGVHWSAADVFMLSLALSKDDYVCLPCGNLNRVTLIEYSQGHEGNGFLSRPTAFTHIKAVVLKWFLTGKLFISAFFSISPASMKFFFFYCFIEILHPKIVICLKCTHPQAISKL